MGHGGIQAMTKKLKFINEIFASVHESASALFSVGGIDKKTMEMFDKNVLLKNPLLRNCKTKNQKN